MALLSACGDDDDDDGEAGSSNATSTGSGETSGGTDVEVEGYDDPNKWAGRTLTVTSWGGSFQDAQREALFNEFARATGVEIREDTTDTGKLRAQVEAGAVEWDVCDIGAESVLPLADKGLLEPIDYNIVDKTGIFPDVALEYAVGAIYYSVILAYRTEPFGDNPPSSWADFWDVSGFEGGRSLYNDPNGNLEFALLADGVPMDELFPLDVDRSYAMLDEIKDAVTVWWDAGAQPPQLLTDGEVNLSSAWNGRIDTVQDEGVPVEIQWNQGMLTADVWVVPAGAPNVEIAMDFINFATRPRPMARLAEIIPYGPVHEGAFEFLSEELQASLPSSPELKGKQFVSNWEWWFEHLDEMDERWLDWIQQ